MGFPVHVHLNKPNFDTMTEVGSSAGSRVSPQQLLKTIKVTAIATSALELIGSIPTAEAGFVCFTLCMSACSSATAGAFVPACVAACLAACATNPV